MVDIIGFIGAIAYTVCNIPLVYRAHKTKDVSCFPWLTLHLWSIGNISFLINSIAHNNTPLILDYTMNGFILAYIYYIKTRYKSGI